MKTKIALLMATFATVLIMAAGAVSINLFAQTGARASVNTTNWGWPNQNVSYNMTSINKTAVLKSVAAVAQCRTNYVDTAAPIASSALHISLNTSQINSANAKLQANVSSNASTNVIVRNLGSFNSGLAALYFQARAAAFNLNKTQVQSLRTQLNASVQTLSTCTAANGTSTAAVHGRFWGFFGFHFKGFHLFFWR
jgi:hypothetical protein